MRLRELELPLAVMHPDFLRPVKEWGDMFESVSLESVKSGYFLKMKLFDTEGNEYAVAFIDVISRPWWKRLFSQGVGIDAHLRRVSTYSAEQLKTCFENHLKENPSWWMNNEGVRTPEDIARGFGSGRSCHEAIDRLEWFSREVY